MGIRTLARSTHLLKEYGVVADPILETKRLILRWFTPDDAAFVYELLNQPAWKRYIGDRGIDSVEAARDYIETVLIASYRRHGFGLFAMELKANDTLVGM